MKFEHKPVLLNECIKALNIKPNGVYVDGTLGGAGHSTKILENLSKDGLLIGIDRDLDALHVAKERLESVGANILGTVLNKMELKGSDNYYYNYYYQDQNESKGGRKRLRRK